MEKLIAWREFCNNGKLKLLKDTKGHAWVVQITDNPSRSIDVRSERMPTTISFNWIEVEDISSVSIIVIGECGGVWLEEVWKFLVTCSWSREPI